jgi:RimJ/RimL family protein N-acetyltransferase
MTLVTATPDDHDVIDGLWRLPQNAQWIEPPEDGEIARSIDEGLAFLWRANGAVTGCAVLMTWVPQVFGLSAIVSVMPGQGGPFLRAILGKVFGPMNGHRIGFDVTADNARAIRLYEGLGFQREGVIRECWKRPGGDWADCHLMGLLAREWQP